MEPTNKKFLAFGGAFLVIVVVVFAVAIPLATDAGYLNSGSLVGEPRYSVKKGDVIYHGLIDEYKRGDEKLGSFKAVLESKVLDKVDLSIDDDSLPDLTIMNSILLGDTDFGEIRIPQVLDIYTFSTMLNLLLGSPSEITIPSLNAMHFVSSQEAYLIQKIMDKMNENQLANALPQITFEMDELGSYPQAFWNESHDAFDSILVEDSINYARVINSTNAGHARHNSLEFSANQTGNVLIMEELMNVADTPMSTNGELSFYIKIPNTANTDLMIWHGSMSNGIHLLIDDGVLKYQLGSVFWNGAAFDSSDPGGIHNTGYSFVDSNWHKITLRYRWSPYSGLNKYSYDLVIDEKFNLTTLSTTKAFELKQIPLSLSSSTPSTEPWYMMFFGNQAKTSSPSVVQLDDFYFENSDFTYDSTPLKQDFADMMIKLLSIYHVSILPENFNYNLIIDLVNLVNLYVNYTLPLDIWMFEVTNTTSELRISISSDTVADVLDFIETYLIGMDISLWEGDASVSFTVAWDKQIGVLKESIMTVNYEALNIQRNMGARLIATSMKGDAYPDHPSRTDYAPLFDEVEAGIQNYVIIMMLVTIGVSVAAVFGIQALVGYMKKKR